MPYFIFSDRKTTCISYFPDRLSTFFGSIGGFAGKAEPAQVSRVLKIDLSVFQDVGYDETDSAVINNHWHKLSEFARIVDTLIVKIKAQPRYFTKIIYDPDYQKYI